MRFRRQFHFFPRFPERFNVSVQLIATFLVAISIIIELCAYVNQIKSEKNGKNNFFYKPAPRLTGAGRKVKIIIKPKGGRDGKTGNLIKRKADKVSGNAA